MEEKKIVINKWPIIALVFTVLFDQYTKQLVLSHLGSGDVISVIPGYFDLILVFNPGFAFGMLADWSSPVREIAVGCTILFALGAVIFLLKHDYYQDPIGQIALFTIMGGALGNIVDRLSIGQVVDFFDVYYGSYHWPAFNIADSAICLGVFVLLLRKPGTRSLGGD